MKIESLVPVTDKPNILATFNLMTHEGFVIRGVKLMTSAKGKWISFPSRSYKDPSTQETKYFDHVMIPKEIKEALVKEIKQLVESELCKISPGPSVFNHNEEIPF